MSTNRITGYAAPAASGPNLPSGFAVCHDFHATQNPLAIQLLAQQQAYEQALLVAREEALRIALERLKMSLN